MGSSTSPPVSKVVMSRVFFNHRLSFDHRVAVLVV